MTDDAYIRGLEAELALLTEARDLAITNRNYWQAEAYAIRARTIEKCASKVRTLKLEGASPSWNDAIDEAVDTIEGALAQTEPDTSEI